MNGPDELRELADEMDADKHSPEFFAAVTRTAADAWEIDKLSEQGAQAGYRRLDRENRDLRKRLEAAEELLADLRCSAIEFKDPRVGYVTVQIDRGTWAALAGEEADMLTPQTLRKLAPYPAEDEVEFSHVGVKPEDIDAHADAWDREQRDALEMHANACALWEEVVALRKRLEEEEKALRQIAKGEGRFSRDALTHASNTVEDMKALAVAALAGEEK